VERRAFIVSLGAGVLATPLAARAQQAGKVARIGLLDLSNPRAAGAAWWNAFRERLRELGTWKGRMSS
jgi:thioesterase domain-containing protein